jgi:hypothetical protein
MDDWANENFVAQVLEAEASLFDALSDQTLQTHEVRCDRIVRAVMTRIAALPDPR